MKNIVFILIMLASLQIDAQDVIVKKDGTTILSKVLEVNLDDVKYKKFSNPDGPTYTISKEDIMSINYENGEKDDFNDVKKTVTTNQSPTPQTNGLIKKEPDSRNEEIIALYNKIYQPSSKVKQKDKPAYHCIVIIGVKEESIMSNNEVEMKLIRKIIDNPHNGGYKEQRYFINITNKTDRTIYFDKGNCFRLNSTGESFCYYNGSEQVTTNQGGNFGASIGLGSIANTLGIGGAVGQVASGMKVGGSSSSSLSKTYAQERFVAIPPHANKNLVEDRFYKSEGGMLLIGVHASYEAYESSEDFSFCDNYYFRVNSLDCGLAEGDINRGQIKIYGENDLPWRREYYLTYSTEPDFRTYSTLNTKLYIHEVIGDAGDISEDRLNYKYIQDIDDYTINGTMILMEDKTKKRK